MGPRTDNQISLLVSLAVSKVEVVKSLRKIQLLVGDIANTRFAAMQKSSGTRGDACKCAAHHQAQTQSQDGLHGSLVFCYKDLERTE
jgi:hypothetical protein